MCKNVLFLFYSCKIRYGHGNNGNYRLKKEHLRDLFIDSKYIKTRIATEPSEIIKSLNKDKEELFRHVGVSLVRKI